MQAAYGSRFNENQRLKERYVRFNAVELVHAAVRAANKERCVGFVKLAEGGFNKVFLLTMGDGAEVIARIPTPIASPPHYSTASEVATMDFLRSVLEIPVPRVLGYSTAADNPVGAEYILMECLRGESLASRWLSLSTAEMKDVLTQLVKIEKRIFSYKFPAYGSLYYKRDVAGVPHTAIPQLEQFCVGPIAKRQFYFDERKEMELDRGPCKPFFPCAFSFHRALHSWLVVINR